MNGHFRTRHFLFYFIVICAFISGTFLGNQVVSVISQSQPILRIHTIVIDPGHGGEDGGATSCTGRLESAYNLDISLRLRDLLHFLGCSTVMTRTKDTAIYTQGTSLAQKKASDLKERVKIANQREHTVLVSIHQNKFPEPQYHGAQVFYNHVPGSRDLAEQLQTLLVNALNPGSNRKAKQGSGIYILEKTNCPGILIECGFLSNSEEEHLLSSPEYQKRLACVISSMISCNISGT